MSWITPFCSKAKLDEPGSPSVPLKNVSIEIGMEKKRERREEEADKRELKDYDVERMRERTGKRKVEQKKKKQAIMQSSASKIVGMQAMLAKQVRMQSNVSKTGRNIQSSANNKG